jgi:hypothetical protein
MMLIRGANHVCSEREGGHLPKVNDLLKGRLPTVNDVFKRRLPTVKPHRKHPPCAVFRHDDRPRILGMG